MREWEGKSERGRTRGEEWEGESERARGRKGYRDTSVGGSSGGNDSQVILEAAQTTMTSRVGIGLRARV